MIEGTIIWAGLAVPAEKDCEEAITRFSPSWKEEDNREEMSARGRESLKARVTEPFRPGEGLAGESRSNKDKGAETDVTLWQKATSLSKSTCQFSPPDMKEAEGNMVLQTEVREW